MTQKFMTFQIADLERQSPKDFIKSRLDLQDELLHELKLLKQDLNSKLELEINQEYTSFISLPQNLIGSDEIIADFQVKLRGALDALDEISKEYQGDSKLIKDLIEKRQEIRKEKQKLKIQVQISERLSKVAKLPSPSISSINQFEDYCKKLDRYSIEFNQLQFLSSQVGGAGGHEKLEILEMKTNLTKSIQSCLKICFEELLQTNGLTVSKKEVEEKPERLVRNEQATLVLNFCCETLVRISSTLGTLNPTMEIFKQVIIDPFLVKLGLYQEHELFPAIRGFLESNCSIIDTVANSRQSFVVEGWQVIGQYLLDNQPMIFHVSSPQRFHDLFQASQKVLDFVMSTSDLSIQLKSGNVYRDYCKRWQLSVYFQLINNQHVSNFEQTLAAEVVFEKSENQDLMTKPSKLLVKILQHVWGPTVFIRQLGHRFMKMTIVIIYRYIEWFKGIHNQSKLAEIPTTDLLLDLYRESFLISQHFVKVSDIIKILLLLEPDSITNLDAKISTITSLMPTNEILDDLVTSLTKSLTPIFQNISTIPAHFRLTNKPIPTAPSAFMSNIFKDISIYINHHPVLEPKRLDIATKIFEMYSLAVVQVLESVKQIEENLKRFKRKNTETKVSDEYKVRTQIKIDTMDFIEQIKSFGIENLGDGKEQDLVKLVNESLLN